MDPLRRLHMRRSASVFEDTGGSGYHDYDSHSRDSFSPSPALPSGSRDLALSQHRSLSNHSFRPPSPTHSLFSEGYISAPQSNNSTQRQYIQNLEMQLADSRTEIRILEREVSFMKESYQSLLSIVEAKLTAADGASTMTASHEALVDRIPYYHNREGIPILFGPPLVAAHQGDSSVRFWDDNQWKKYDNSDAGKKAKALATHGQMYMEFCDGQPIDDQTAKQVRKVAARLFYELLDKGLAPATWKVKASSISLWFYAWLEHEFPFLRECAQHWKADMYGTLSYPSWYLTHVRSKAPAAIKPELQEEMSGSLKRQAETLQEPRKSKQRRHSGPAQSQPASALPATTIFSGSAGTPIPVVHITPPPPPVLLPPSLTTPSGSATAPAFQPEELPSIESTNTLPVDSTTLHGELPDASPMEVDVAALPPNPCEQSSQPTTARARAEQSAAPFPEAQAPPDSGTATAEGSAAQRGSATVPTTGPGRMVHPFFGLNIPKSTLVQELREGRELNVPRPADGRQEEVTCEEGGINGSSEDTVPVSSTSPSASHADLVPSMPASRQDVHDNVAAASSSTPASAPTSSHPSLQPESALPPRVPAALPAPSTALVPSATTKSVKPKRAKPADTNTVRNHCKRAWCGANPTGTEEEFRTYYETVKSDVVIMKPFRDLVNTLKASKG